MFPQLDSPATQRHCLDVVRPALLLAPSSLLDDVHRRLSAAGIQTAVAAHDTPTLFDWIVRLLARQGISNRAAEVFINQNGSPRWADVARYLAVSARCSRLTSFWSFAECGYRRSSGTCNTPHHLVGCVVPALSARKGSLAIATVVLRLFVRDICEGDLVGWIDRRLADADTDQGCVGSNRVARLRASVLDPLVNIPGTGPKVWSMILAELLIGADPDRERWVTTGASFVAIDSLIHAFLARTGVLRRLDARHTFGPACATPNGCTGIIDALAHHIDAREFNPSFPRSFPRWLQYGIWRFCAEGGWGICNGSRIDDALGCKQRFCPSFAICKKMVIKPHR